MSRRPASLGPAAAGVLLAMLASGCKLTWGRGSSPVRGATVVRVLVTPQGCAPKPSLVRPGLVEVVVANLDAPAVSEVELRTSNFAEVLGERENLIEGLSGAFSAELSSGHYIVNCPGAAQAHWSLVVAGKRQGSSASH